MSKGHGYQDIRIANHRLTTMQIRTIQTTKRITQTTTITLISAIRTMMSIGTAEKKTTAKIDLQ